MIRPLSNRYITFKKKMRQVPGAVPLVRFLRRRLTPHGRAITKLERATERLLLQPSPVTKYDRYPEFFAFVRDQLATTAAPRVLSYGCSTGEEVFSLRPYFPAAHLTGIDINPYNIVQCKRRWQAAGSDPEIQFLCAGSPTDTLDEYYDAIFCMAVLRHGALQAAQPERCDAILSFAQIDSLVSDLACALKPGGYLIVWNCHFRFTDMTAASGFDVALTSVDTGGGNSPLYGRDNCRLDVPEYRDAVFRKRVA
jgi:SAM-dependent methyltransferase